MSAKIFYFVDHTANFAGNSGIQRVAGDLKAWDKRWR